MLVPLVRRMDCVVADSFFTGSSSEEVKRILHGGANYLNPWQS